MPAPSHPLVHLELHTADLARARAFYAQLLGWRAAPVAAGGGEYVAFDLGRDVGGGFVSCPSPRSAWLPYVEVGDVGAVTARAADLGAAVLLGPREGPSGWRSIVSTPEAGELALWQRKRSTWP